MQKIVFFCSFFLLTLFNACQSGAQTKLNPDDFQAALQREKTVQLIDVRTPDEFKSGHLEGAININFHDKDFAEQLATLDKNDPVMVYCAVGGRSGKAAVTLQQLGFTNVTDMAGGINAWKAKNKPVVQ